MAHEPLAPLSDQKRLERLILEAKHPCISIVTQEEQHAREMLCALALGCKEPLWVWTVLRGLHPGIFAEARSLLETENPAAALYHIAHQMEHPAICVMIDLAAHLGDARTLRALREVIHRFSATGSTLVLLDHQDQLPPSIAAEATRVELSLPDEDELEQLIRSTLNSVHRERKVEAKLPRRDLKLIIRNLRGLTRQQARQIIIDSVIEDQRFDADDINHVLAHKRRVMQQSGVLEYVESPVRLDDIGGLANLKRWLEQRRNASSDAAREFGISSPRGVLLLGVQGAGKSIAAKAAATAWQQPLLRLDPGALYDRFIGESERRLRDCLHQVEMMAPAVLWIDEIEKGFASAAAHSVDGGLSQRMFGTLLTWMQDHAATVFIVATANNIEALPPELLRKGRFDEIFFVDLPNEAVRREIFAIHLRQRKRDPEKFDLDHLARAAEGFTGAEIEQAVLSGLYAAFDAEEELTDAHLLQAIASSPPLSVTMAERLHALRQWASGRCVPAD